MRVSDREREQIAAQLRRHYEEGRLQLEELNERLDLTYAARTHAELARVLTDLPKPPPPLRPRRERERRTLLGLGVSWAALNAFMILIWAANGAEGDFWPKWVLIISTFVFVMRAIKVFWPELEQYRHHRPPRPPRLPRL
jgi:hypothetical protein